MITENEGDGVLFHITGPYGRSYLICMCPSILEARATSSYTYID